MNVIAELEQDGFGNRLDNRFDLMNGGDGCIVDFMKYHTSFEYIEFVEEGVGNDMGA